MYLLSSSLKNNISEVDTASYLKCKLLNYSILLLWLHSEGFFLNHSGNQKEPARYRKNVDEALLERDL